MRLDFLALLAGCGFVLGFSPYGLAAVVPVTLAALFLVWRGASTRRCAWRGWLFGLGMFGHGVWWVQLSIHQFGLPLYTFSVTMTVLFVIVLALYPALCGYLAARLRADDSGNASWLLLVAPALWVALEWLRCWLFTGFPWLLAGYSQIDSPLGAYLPMVGALGVSVICALLGAALAVAWTGPGRLRAAALTAAALIVAAGVPLDRLRWTEPVGRPLTAAVVQGAIPQEIKWRRDLRLPSLELYWQLTNPHWDADLVVWPETAIPAFPEEVPEFLARLERRMDETGGSLMVGMPIGDRAGQRYFNGIVQVGEGTGRYAKHHLVPFGEYLPFEELLRPLLTFWALPLSKFSAGPREQPPVRVAGQRVGITICYEDAYPYEVARALPEAAFLVNISNDAWFGDSVAPHQHLEISRVRAREAGRWLVRATNTGISAIVDDHGEVVTRTPQFQPAAAAAEIQPLSGATPFVRFGEVPALLATFGLLALGAGLQRRAARR